MVGRGGEGYEEEKGCWRVGYEKIGMYDLDTIYQDLDIEK